METVDIGQPAAPEGVPQATTARRPRRRFRLTRSKKMLVGVVLLGIFVILAIIGPIIAPHSPTALGPLQGPPLAGSTVPSQLPSGHHWLGQTNIGGDIFSQMLAGTRPTVIVSFLAGAIATVLAIIIGISAGYIGGLVDEILSMLANIFLVIPALPLLIAIGAFLGPDKTGNPLVVSLIIALTGWAWGARVLRAQALSMRSRDFVEAARISGESTWRIVIAEIMPNLTAVIASSFLFTTIYAIGTYVGLGFLTVVSAGADYNWGTILFDATSSSAVESGFWWWYINPRLRVAAGARKTRKTIGVKLRPQLGFTPVVRQRPLDESRRPAGAGLEEAL